MDGRTLRVIPTLELKHYNSIFFGSTLKLFLLSLVFTLGAGILAASVLLILLLKPIWNFLLSCKDYCLGQLDTGFNTKHGKLEIQPMVNQQELNDESKDEKQLNDVNNDQMEEVSENTDLGAVSFQKLEIM